MDEINTVHWYIKKKELKYFGPDVNVIFNLVFLKSPKLRNDLIFNHRNKKLLYNFIIFRNL